MSSQSVVDYVDSESSPEEEEQTLEQETQTEDGGATREEEKKERKQINLFHRRPDYRHLYSKYSRGWTSTTAAVTEAPEATTSARSEEGAAFGSRLPATRASSRTSTATSVSFSSSSSSSSNSNNIRSNKTRTTSHYPYSGRKERTRTTTATPVPQAPTTGPALFVGKLASMQPLLQDPSEEEAIEVPVASSRQDFKKVFSSNAAGVHVTRHGTHAGQRHALLPLLPPNAAPTSSPQ